MGVQLPATPFFVEIMEASLIEEKYKDRLNGYTSVLRVDFILLKKLEMTEREWYLYMLIKEVITDWDSRHKLYGYFTYDERQIAFYTKWKNAKIKRVFNTLFRKGLFTLTDKSKQIYHVEGFELKNQIFKKRKKGNEQ